MIITTYTCDKCGHEQTNDNQMWNIGVAIHHQAHDSRYAYSREPMVKGLWCRPCIESIGLLCPAPKPDDKDVKPAPTLEDMIREIVANEVEGRGD